MVLLLLGHDEGDSGAVRLQGLGCLPSPTVEHGQSGQRRRNTAVSRHLSQLITITMNGVVVIELNSTKHKNTTVLDLFVLLQHVQSKD